MISILLTLVGISVVFARHGFGPTDQEWGYVDVRPESHMFWWLHRTTRTTDDGPLVVWLQGGPGASATGYGNFMELGPWDLDLNPRNTTWVEHFDVLFVDNPVGAGFSFVDSYDRLPTTNAEVAADFLVFVREFLEALPEFRSKPWYIFSESYGGKMAVDIALGLYEKDMVQLRGIGLGDPWISPVDSVLTWAPYLYSLGAVDKEGAAAIQEIADQASLAAEEGDWRDAVSFIGTAQRTVLSYTENIDFYNVLTKIPHKDQVQRKKDAESEKLEQLMNGPVRDALGLGNVTWGGQQFAIYIYLQEDFPKPVTESVETLLNTTSSIKVALYNGQLDLLVDLLGTMKWLDNLQFDGRLDWDLAERKSMIVNGTIEGYYKKSGSLSFYWVERSGHMVPVNNPAAMWYILNDVTDGFISSNEALINPT